MNNILFLIHPITVIIDGRSHNSIGNKLKKMLNHKLNIPTCYYTLSVSAMKNDKK